MKYDILKNLVYILQSEHYDRNRFLVFSYKNFFKLFSIAKRGEIVWTLRAKEEYFLALLFLIIDTFSAFYYFWNTAWVWLIPFIELAVLPLWVYLADIFIAPYIEYKKNKIRKKARDILDSKKIKVIGITGSYGKTTAKNILEKVLLQKYKILKTPGNINTDMGVSNFIIEKEKELDNYDFVIIEMGAYRIGDIKLLCDITNPEYSLTTAIGQSHLERFGSQENIIRAKFELAQNTKNKAYLNICNENIKNNIGRFINNNNVFQRVCVEDSQAEFLEDFKGLSFNYKSKNFKTKLLAKHNIGTFALVIELARELNLTLEEIKKSISEVEYIPHRLEVIRNKQTGVIVLDDSYNGNEAGFISALEILESSHRRKVVLTPGIVELGEEESKRVHKKLAKLYQEKIDLVLLVKNQNTKIIEEEFKDNNFENYKIYLSAQDAHEDLGNILRKDDVIVFQNDLPDNYN